ncbi:hypothetical protein T484DRAFT_1980204 [Baffinella frigidus]|nr:hypothetical protein T484DRAFT_1980204 [Cryptophyta sp. CCMP2293]
MVAIEALSGPLTGTGAWWLGKVTHALKSAWPFPTTPWAGAEPIVDTLRPDEPRGRVLRSSFLPEPSLLRPGPPQAHPPPPQDAPPRVRSRRASDGGAILSPLSYMSAFTGASWAGRRFFEDAEGSSSTPGGRAGSVGGARSCSPPRRGVEAGDGEVPSRSHGAARARLKAFLDKTTPPLDQVGEWRGPPPAEILLGPGASTIATLVHRKRLSLS